MSTCNQPAGLVKTRISTGYAQKYPGSPVQVLLAWKLPPAFHHWHSRPSTIAYGIIRKACEPILEEIALRQETSKSILEIPNEVVCVCRYVYVLWALCGQSS